MIQVMKVDSDRIRQGDIFKNVELIEYVKENNGNIVVSKVVFPLVIVLTQDCDLAQDYTFRTEKKPTQDKMLLSVIVAPIYNAEHLFMGEHLTELGLEMSKINKHKTEGKYLEQNDRPRYHYLEFPPDIFIPPSIIDFKHYFTVNVEYLKEKKNEDFVCGVAEIYREDISQRFSSFLSRIGLP